MSGLTLLPLRAKLALLASGLTLVGIALGLSIVYWSLVQLRITGFDNESRLIAEVILETATLRTDQTLRIPRVAESYLTDESGVSAAQAFMDGALVWEGGVIDAPRPLDAERVLSGSGAQSVDEWRVFTFRDEETDIVVQVGRPLLGFREVLRPYNDVALPLTVVLALGSGALAWVLTGFALRPLRRLTAAAERFEDGESVPGISGSDEPARLATSFAELLARLRTERQREQEFLEFAAHELRTPISALRAGLESAASGRVPATPDILARLRREALRLEVFAENLLVLSRAESRVIRPEPLDLPAILSDAYDRLLPLALERDVELVLQVEPASVRGDARLLGQALNNLVSNALRHGRGPVTLRCGAIGAEAFLEVCDAGPGLPAAPREGLGLRVVRAVAEAHEGTVRFERGHGMCVRMKVPGLSG